MTYIDITKEQLAEIKKELDKRANNLIYKKKEFWRYCHGASLMIRYILNNKPKEILEDLELKNG